MQWPEYGDGTVKPPQRAKTGVITACSVFTFNPQCSAVAVKDYPLFSIPYQHDYHSSGILSRCQPGGFINDFIMPHLVQLYMLSYFSFYSATWHRIKDHSRLSDLTCRTKKNDNLFWYCNYCIVVPGFFITFHNPQRLQLWPRPKQKHLSFRFLALG